MDKQSSQGTLLAIAYREAPRSPMKFLESAAVTTENGVPGDHRGKPGHRQVTILSEESWQAAINQLGVDVPWSARRANLLIRGIDLQETKGRRVRIGDLELEITGETRACGRMEEASPGLQSALGPEWRGGVTCQVINSGFIQVGTLVEVLPHPEIG